MTTQFETMQKQDDVERVAKKQNQRAPVQRRNLAIWRIMHGKGSMTEELSILLGKSRKAIEARSFRAEKTHTPEQLNDDSGRFTKNERRYILSRYAKSKDPAVREFVRGITSSERN